MILYNDHDRYCVQWLHNLIAAGHLPAGDVDARDIRTLTAQDLAPYDVCHFFAGIGGWPYALTLAGWPTTRPVWTASCPCQPFSQAGQRRGTADERHLWPTVAALVAECHPPTLFGEQVASRDGRAWLAGVQADLESLGYAVGAADLCAAGLGAPHLRQRLFWVANTQCAKWRAQYCPRRNEAEHGLSQRQESPSGARGDSQDDRLALADSQRLQGRQSSNDQQRSACPQRVQASRDGQPDGMGYALSDGTERPGRPQYEPDATSKADRMEHAAGQRTDTSQQPRLLRRPQQTSPPRGMDDTNKPHQDQWASSGQQPVYDERHQGRFWDTYDVISCEYGKLRRIEPGTFPLATGIPARMGRLRAYGNAIVPQVAATFIRAFLEAERGLSHV